MSPEYTFSFPEIHLEDLGGFFRAYAYGFPVFLLYVGGLSFYVYICFNNIVNDLNRMGIVFFLHRMKNTINMKD